MGSQRLILYFCLICVVFVQISYSLYEDQVGKFDWTQRYVGKAKFMIFDHSGQISRRVVVATEQNVLASLSARDGQIGWRAVFEEDNRGRIDDVIVTKNYVISIHGGGEYVRCFKSITGQLHWENSVTTGVAEHRGKPIAVSTKTDVAVLTKHHVIVYNVDTGDIAYKKSLPESDNVIYSMLVQHSGDMFAVGTVTGSHVTIAKIAADEVSMHDIPAPWITEQHSCQVIKGHLVCADGQSLQVVALFDGKVFVPFDGLRTLGVVGQLSVERFCRDETMPEFFVRASPTHVIVLTLNPKAEVIIVNNLKGVAVVQIGQLSDQSGDAQRFLFAIESTKSTQGIQVSVFSLPTGAPQPHLSLTFQSKQFSATPQQMRLMLFHKKDGSTGFRILLLSEDDGLTMLSGSSGGRVLWTREEALASIVSVEMLDLPLSEIQAEMEDEFGSHGDDVFALFFRRITTQLTQLKTFVSQLKHKLMTHRHAIHSSSGSDDDDDDGDVTEDGVDDDDDDDYLTRDEFNLHKIVVTVTSPGKILGLDSTSGRILWHHFLPDIGPLLAFGRATLPLFVQRTTAHFPNPPQCAVLGRHRVTGEGIVYAFNPITGQPIKGMPPGGELMKLQTKQVTMLAQFDDHFLHPLVILDSSDKYTVYPASDTEMVRQLSDSLYMFTTDVSAGSLTGFAMVPTKNEGLQALKLWSVDLQKESQVITHVEVKRAVERVHSQGIVLADRSVLYKYLNPNLVAVATEDKTEKSLLTIYLLDAVTGNLVFHCSHKRARGPVQIVHSENWITYSYWNVRYRRTEVAVLELYEGKRQSNATSFSSLDPPPPPLVMRQAYVFSGHVRTMAATVTEKGLTNKHLLIALNSGGVLELPKALMDPRRPIVLTADHREEGIMPYMPELPRPYEAIINYNQSIFNTRGIHTAPSGLESTCLVLCYGLDLFYTRVTPSKMFDVLKEDFDYLFISAVLVGMVVVSFVTQKLATRKALNRAWK